MVPIEPVMLGLDQLANWGLLTTDANLTITGWNPWLEAHSGVAAEQIVGQSLLAQFPDLITRRLDQFFRQALEGRVAVLSQRLHRYLLPMPPTTDGFRLPHMQQSARITPLVVRNVVVGTLTVIEDVTERVAYDAEINARTRQQAAIAEMGQLALGGGDLLALMRAAATTVAETLGVETCAIFELTPDERGLLLQAGVGWAEECLGRTTEDAGPHTHAGYILRAPTPVIMEDVSAEPRLSASPLLQAHNIVSGIGVSLAGARRAFGVVAVYARQPQTFTNDQVHFLQTAANVLGMAIERKRLERELQQRMDQLAEADRRKDEFVAMLAHELRNPLAPIGNAVRVLRLKGADDPEVRYAQDVIVRQVQHMTRLVDDLLDVSRITRGKVNLAREPVALAAVVESAIELSRPRIDARRHELKIDLPADEVLVEADRARLAQVVANLLNNAAKYTEEGGVIHLTLERRDAEAVIRVRDTGVGIAPDMLSSIFDLFTQAQGSVSRSEGGLGIGLALVRSLVEMHGGSVSATSAGLGRGSEFTVRLPLLIHAGTASAAVPPTSPRQRATRRMLVVDDNVDSRESLAMLLRLFGHAVETASDGPAALQAARLHAPEVVILDIGLPGMSGLDVARQMRSNLGMDTALLVALTGYGQDEDRQLSQAAGFDAHMVKPVDFDDLQRLLALKTDSIQDTNRS